MGLIAKEPEGGGDFDPVAQGVHMAIAIGIFDLGTQHNETYDKMVHKILIMWELPDERIEIEKDGEKRNLPKATSRTYTLSLHEKAALRKDLEAWRGRSFTKEELEGFDIFKILGHGCQIQIIHKVVGDKTYANIASIMALPKDTKMDKPENELRQYSIEDNGLNIPENIPGWIKDLIKKSEEYKGLAQSGITAEEEPPIEAYEDPERVPF